MPKGIKLVLHYQNKIKALKRFLYLLCKFGSLDLNKCSTHSFQITALVVKGYTSRSWKKKEENNVNMTNHSIIVLLVTTEKKKTKKKKNTYILYIHTHTHYYYYYYYKQEILTNRVLVLVCVNACIHNSSKKIIHDAC